jgi:hypothetical protein
LVCSKSIFFQRPWRRAHAVPQQSVRFIKIISHVSVVVIWNRSVGACAQVMRTATGLQQHLFLRSLNATPEGNVSVRTVSAYTTSVGNNGDETKHLLRHKRFVTLRKRQEFSRPARYPVRYMCERRHFTETPRYPVHQLNLLIEVRNSVIYRILGSSLHQLNV